MAVDLVSLSFQAISSLSVIAQRNQIRIPLANDLKSRSPEVAISRNAVEGVKRRKSSHKKSYREKRKEGEEWEN